MHYINVGQVQPDVTAEPELPDPPSLCDTQLKKQFHD